MKNNIINKNRLCNMINKKDFRFTFYRKGTEIVIQFGSYYQAGKFCSLLNKIGDANYYGKR